MPTWLDGTTVLDAVIGKVAADGSANGAAAEGPIVPVASVHITGDLTGDPRAEGLADDIRLLVAAFLREPRSDPEPSNGPASDDDVRISLPDLHLDEDAHRVVAYRIRRLVAERTHERTTP